MKVGDILSTTTAKLGNGANKPQSSAPPTLSVPDLTCSGEISSTQFHQDIELAFERGFRRGWRSAIEAGGEVDWDNLKVGGTD